MMQTRSTCPYCGVGCGVIIESDGAQITGVRGDPEHPANLGRLCTKGSTLALTAAAPELIDWLADYQRDIARLNPIHLMVVGVLMALAFVGILILIVNWVAG